MLRVVRRSFTPSDADSRNNPANRGDFAQDHRAMRKLFVSSLPLCNVCAYSFASDNRPPIVATITRGSVLGITVPFAHLAQEEK
jgi:hypothetical protein